MDANVFKALGHPERLRVIELLSTRERTVSELVLSLGLSQPTVSKHLAVLRLVNLVKVEARGMKRVYRINRRVPMEVSSWALRAATDEPEYQDSEYEGRVFKVPVGMDYSDFERGFAAV